MVYVKKGLSPVIAVILLLSVTVILSISIFNFLQNNVEDLEGVSQTIEFPPKTYLSGSSEILIEISENLNISQVFLGGVECSNNSQYVETGYVLIDISSCISNATSPTLTIKGQENEILNFEILDLDVDSKPQESLFSSCILDSITRSHGQSYNFFNTVSGLSCSSESRNCDDGNYTGNTTFQFGSCLVLNFINNQPLETADFSILSPEARYNTGFPIDSGDFNGDGYSDILLGSEWSEPTLQNNQGEISVFFGGSTYSPNTSLSLANASFYGEIANDNAGHSVSSAGDVNNDGYDDILVGAYNNGGSSEGKVYLIFGKSSGWSQNVNINTANASFLGEDSTDQAGHSVSSAGDVNGDGYDDILIGAFGDEEGNSGNYGGQVYLIFGKSSGWTSNQNLNTADASFIGENAGERLSRVAPAGDINNDGYDDFIMSAYWNDDGGSDSGKIYVVFGKSSGWSMNQAVNTVNSSFYGESSGDRLGSTLGKAGDVNGDGYGDILVSSYSHDSPISGVGKTYLILGSTNNWGLDLNISSASNSSFYGSFSGNLIGQSSSIVGDVNNDGYDDILISGVEESYLVLGQSSNWGNNINISTVSNASFVSSEENEKVGPAGDINNDGYFDFMISYDSYTPSKLMIFYGNTLN